MTSPGPRPFCGVLLPSACLAGWLSLALFFGCGGSGRPEGDLPQLHAARGKVTRSGAPVAGGLVQLRPVAPSAKGDLIVTAAVGPDGGFELATTHALSQRKAAGAPEGEYAVTYHPPGETQDLTPVTPAAKVTIRSGPNELSIDLARP